MASPDPSTAINKLIPREYQNEIFLKARQSNIIAAMDTGTGKTLIAVSLIKWISSRITDDATRKVIIFLVPRVALANQQQAVVSSQTSLKAKAYYGAMNVDYWARAQWEREFAEFDVLVMTPQVFYSVLNHAHWRMDNVSLLIFDEAHHCHKNHAYNQIMRDHYYKCDVARRPKVFGMTASPVWNPNKALEALKELEDNLNARIVGVKENLSQLHEHAAKPIEVKLLYPPTPDSFRRYPFALMSDLIMRSGTAIDADLALIRARYMYALDALGLCGAEYYLSALAPHILLAAIQRRRKANGIIAALGASPDAAQESDPVSQLESLKSKLTEHATRVFQPSFEVKPDWVSPRLRILAERLKEHYISDPDCQTIVFADQRHTVMCLEWLLPHMSCLQGLVTSTFLMGHATTGSGDSPGDMLGMSADDQVKVLKDFGDRTSNLLLATSVAEEGLDFQPCNIVVRFDLLQTIVSYAQSRGRARQKTSTYIVMIPEGTDLVKYDQYQSAEPELRQMYQNRLTSQDILDDDEGDAIPEGDLRLREQYMTTVGASLTYDSAIALLALLCSTLRLDDFTPIMNPLYEEIGTFCYQVTLPSALPLPRESLVYQGPVRSSKREAKRAVAFVAVRTLHRFGCYDDFLYPIRGSTSDEGEDADGDPFIPLDLPDQMETTVLDVWGDPWRTTSLLRCYPLLDEGRACVGLVTTADLRVADLTDHRNTFTDVPGLGSSSTLYFKDEDERLNYLGLMERYTLFLKSWAISRRPTEAKLVYFLVPLLPDSSPDWSAMKLALDKPLYSNWSDYGRDALAGPVLVVDKTSNGRAQVMLRIRPDITPSTPSSSGFQCCRKECNTFEDHAAALSRERDVKWAKRVASGQSPTSLKTYPLPHFSSNEPMVEIQPARLDKTSDVRRIVMVPFSYIKQLSMPLDVFRIAEKLPSLTYHISSMFRARTLASTLGFSACPLGRIVEALTVPRTGTRLDYNRLESLGDTFVKLCTSIHVFNKYPHRHEGQLHVLRKNSIRNLYLQGKSYKLGIHHFAIGERLSTNRRWLPSTIDGIAYDDHTPYIKLKIPRKFLPDTIESLLGASYIYWGIPGVLSTGTLMGLCFGGEASWRARYGSEQRTGLVMPSALQGLEGGLRYKFREPSLLLEAMTHATIQLSNTPSYDRLEFLGDAVIEAFVLEYLFNKYPSATAAQLTWMKSLLVCNSLLGTLALRKLSLHKYLLAFSTALDRAVANAVDEVQIWTYDTLVLKWWEFSPPKVLNDTLEAAIGAVLIDSNYDMDVVRRVLDGIFEDVLPLARPSLPRHPVAELMLWAGRNRCAKVRYRKSSRDPGSTRNDTYEVIVHGVQVSCATREKRQIAKCFASSDALTKLRDPEGEFALHKLCDCAREREEKARQRAAEKQRLREEEEARKSKDAADMDVDDDNAQPAHQVDEAVEPSLTKRTDLDVADIVQAYLTDTTETDLERVAEKAQDDTEEGFAEVGKVLLDALEPEVGDDVEGEDEEDDSDIESEDEDEEMT